MDVYVNGEPAGTWETATGNTESAYHEIDVTGIEDLDALEEYFNETGVIPYEMVNGKKVYVTFAKLPQNNTAVSASAINDLISIAGGSVVAGYNTEGMIAKLSKSLILNAIMRTMFLVIDGNSVEQSVISQLENVLNPFCIAGSNDMPVYVDSSGTAHVFADAVEAVRNALIGIGAYSSGGNPSVNPATVSGLEETGYPNPMVFVDGITSFQEYRVSTSRTFEYTISNATENIRGCQFRANNVGANASGVVLISSAPFDAVRSSDQSVYHAAAYNVGGVTYYAYYNGPTAGKTNEWTITNVSAPTNLIDNTALNSNNMYDYIKLALAAVGGAGVAGLTPSSSIPVGFGDLTLPLPDVWPDWYAKKKQVATPSDDDLYLRSPALPLDVPVDNVFDDGYAGDSEDATTGDLEDILKQAIVDVLPDILADIIDNTAVTPEDVYEIPVDDGGNTPPAEPPVLDGSSNGLWTMYNPTKTQVNEFGAWLWSDTIIDQIIRQFNSPIDAIIGFHQIYCTPSTGAAKVIKAGYLNSPVSAAEVTDQYATIDCGTVHVDEFYGNVLDYDNSQVSVYLPFIGIVPLNTNVVMGSDLQIIYRIDVFTGTCLAQIKVIKENSNAVMYAFDGNCAVQIPLTATTYTGMIGALISGISAGVSFATGDMLHAATSGLSAAMSALQGQTGNKQSGTMGSNAGALGIRKPYLIITRAISSMPAGFESIAGLPSTELVQLGSLSGFTSIRNVHLEGIPGTAEEIEEIKSLLESGVIF